MRRLTPLILCAVAACGASFARNVVVTDCEVRGYRFETGGTQGYGFALYLGGVPAEAFDVSDARADDGADAIRAAGVAVQESEKRVNDIRAAIQALGTPLPGTPEERQRAALQQQLAVAENDLGQATAALSLVRRMAPLKRLINVELRNADVRQAAMALSKTSGMEIRVFDAVPNGVRLTVDAKRVPLASVLEAVAREANLMISPDEAGVALKPWPTVAPGSPSPIIGRKAPWSDEWATLPIEAFGASTGPGVWTPGPGTPRGPFSLGGANVTSVGDSLVVVEKGVKDGQPGLWMTTYRLEGGRLVQKSRDFHTSPPGSDARPLGKPLPADARPPG